MTNKEIKFELAKTALERCAFSTSEAFTEALYNLYNWIVEEPEVEVETTDKNSFDSVDNGENLYCESIDLQDYSTYEEALKYCLENLI